MPDPLYLQTAEALRSRIENGIWKTGDRLPSEQRLCEDMGVSSITMRRAISILVSQGLAVRLQGKGTYVSSNHAVVQAPPELTSFTEDLGQRGWGAEARVLELSVKPADAETAAKLELPEGSPIFVLRRLRLADGLPIAIQDASLPASLFPGLDKYDFTTESLYAVIGRDSGVYPSAATEIYRPSVLTSEEAELLGEEPGSPTFRIERITIDRTGRVIEVIRSTTQSDRYTLVLRLARRGQTGQGRGELATVGGSRFFALEATQSGA